MNKTLIKKDSIKTTVPGKRFCFVAKLYDITKHTMALATIISTLGLVANAQNTTTRTINGEGPARTLPPQNRQQQVTANFLNSLTQSFTNELCDQFSAMQESPTTTCPSHLSERAAEIARFTLQNRFNNQRHANFNSTENIVRYTQYMATVALRSSTTSPITAESFQDIFNRTGLPTSILQARPRTAQQTYLLIAQQRQQRLRALNARLGNQAALARQQAQLASSRFLAGLQREFGALIQAAEGPDSAYGQLISGGSAAVHQQEQNNQDDRENEALDRAFNTPPEQPAPATQQELRQ